MVFADRRRLSWSLVVFVAPFGAKVRCGQRHRTTTEIPW